MAVDYCMYFETVIRGHHAYLQDHELTLGEICTLESDAAALIYDKYVLKFVTADFKTAGHVPKHLSKICFQFIEDGGELDGEVVGKRFNAGTGMGIEVPVELRFVGEKKYLETLSAKIILAEEKLLMSVTDTGQDQGKTKSKTKGKENLCLQKIKTSVQKRLSAVERFKPES